MNLTFSLFPKYYQRLDVRGLAALVREVRLDTTNAVIRDGYWVSPANLGRELPAFVNGMRAEGLEVRFCTAGTHRLNSPLIRLHSQCSPIAGLPSFGWTTFATAGTRGPQ